ncbi:MAG: hypothetical protein V7709_20545 [Halioglobus sp.]
MLNWFKRKPEKEEDKTYCGFILMRSDWYKKQVEDGLIDHTNSLAELEAQGYKNVKCVGAATGPKPE